MKKILSKIILLIFWLGLCRIVLAQEYPFQNPNLSIEERIDNIISLMTLDEKIQPSLD